MRLDALSSAMKAICCAKRRLSVVHTLTQSYRERERHLKGLERGKKRATKRIVETPSEGRIVL